MPQPRSGPLWFCVRVAVWLLGSLLLFHLAANVAHITRAFSAIAEQSTPTSTSDELLARHAQQQQQQQQPELIPRVVHVVYFGFKPLPDGVVHKATESWRALNPGWEVRRWDAKQVRNLIAAHYPWFLSVYDGYARPVQRVDAGRYFILYHFGGVYADLDVWCRRPFEAFLSHHVVLPVTQPLGLSNDLMLAEPRSDFFLQLIHRLEQRNGWYLVPFLSVMLSTGPEFLSYEYCLYPHKQNITLIGASVYTGHDPWVTHRPGNSWHEWDATLILAFAKRPLLGLGVAVLLFCLAVVALVRVLAVVRRWVFGEDERSGLLSEEEELLVVQPR